MKNIRNLVLGLGLAVLSLGLTGCGDQRVGGQMFETMALIDSDGNLTAPISSTTGAFSSTLAVTGTTSLNGDVGLGDAAADTVTLNGQLTSDLTSATGTDFHYIKNSLSATSGTHNFLRVRAQSIAESASTSDLRGIYAQATTQDTKDGGTITAIYANPILKTGTTTVTSRGILIDNETEGTPTAITNMYGMYIRNKSTVAVATDNYSITIDNEKMGTGITQDAGIQLKTTTWADGQNAYTYGIDMNMTGDIQTADIRLSEGDTIANTSAGLITVSNDVSLTDGRFIMGTETGGTCSSGLVIDLSVAAKGVLTTMGETNTACAVSFTNGTAGELVILSHDYNGTGIITFADVTGYDASWTPVTSNCTGKDAAVTAAANDHFYIQGVMTSATEIMITGCQYFDAA